MADLKTTAEERAELDALHAAATAGEWYRDERGYTPGVIVTLAFDGSPTLDGRSILRGNTAWPAEARANEDFAMHAKNAWPAFSARLRAAEAEVERLRGEVASLALLVNPQAAREAAATARDNRVARAVLATHEDDDLINAAVDAMARVELYKAMWRRNEGSVGLASLAMHVGLAECERLRSEGAELRGLVRWFLDGDGHAHEEDCGARGQHDRDVCRVAGCGDAECEGPHCTCDATEMRDRARAALGEP